MRAAASWPRLEVGFGFPLGFVAGIVTTMVAVAAGATHDPGAALVALAVVVGVVSAVTTVAGAVATGAASWALYDGFVLGRAGHLVLVGSSAQAAVVLLATAVTATAAGVAVRFAAPAVVSSASWPRHAARTGRRGWSSPSAPLWSVEPP
jgi:hypothetical protein